MIHIPLFITAFLSGALALRAAQDAADQINDWRPSATGALLLALAHLALWFLCA